MSSNLKIERKCEYCGNSFVARTLFTRYCSHRCNSRHYKELARQQKIEIHVNQTNQVSGDVRHAANDYMPVKEAGAVMRVSTRTLYRLIKEQKLKKKKVCSRTVILRKDIQTFFDYQ